MFDIISNREFATIVWSIAFFAFVSTSISFRLSAKRVIKTAFSKQLFIPFIFMVLLTAIIAYLFSLTIFWDAKYIKDIIIWMLFSGITIFYSTVHEGIESGHFKKIILNNVSIVAGVLFVISFYNFNLAAELIIYPVIIFAIMIVTFISDNEDLDKLKRFIIPLAPLLGGIVMSIPQKVENRHQYKRVAKVFLQMLYVYFVIVCLITLNNFYFNANNFIRIDTLISFILPLILSAFYVPFSFLFGIYAKYDTVFRRMHFKDKDDVRKKHRRKLFKTCFLSYRKLLFFEKNGWKNMYQGMAEKEFDSLLKSIKSYKLSDGKVDL